MHILKNLAAVVGIEPTINWLTASCHATWLHRIYWRRVDELNTDAFTPPRVQALFVTVDGTLLKLKKASTFQGRCLWNSVVLW